MKQNQINDLPNLAPENFENIFTVHSDHDGKYFYNLLQTIIFPQNLPITMFDIYTISHGDTWPFISYKVYKTTNLWWVILLANKIINPTLKPSPGKNLAIPKTSVVREILSQMEKT